MKTSPLNPAHKSLPRREFAVLSRFLVPGDPLYMPEQEKNVTTLIRLYKEGKITVNDEIFVADGRLVSKEEYITTKAPCFWEVSLI